jgi:hypothetical protein
MIERKLLDDVPGFRDPLGDPVTGLKDPVGPPVDEDNPIVDPVTPPNAPVVSGTTPTNDQTPTWTWISGGGGDGNYRRSFDNATWTETTATSYTPGSNLSEATHTLYVQERNGVDNWSASGSKAIVIDITAPDAPSVFSINQVSEYCTVQSTGTNSWRIDSTDPAVVEYMAIEWEGVSDAVSYRATRTYTDYLGSRTVVYIVIGNVFTFYIERSALHEITIQSRDAAGNLSDHSDTISILYVT